MSCKHRFLDELIPDWKLEYLFIGTFNPSWDSDKDENKAIYFYGRSRNHFWTIIPNIFGGLSSKGKSKEILLQYIKDRSIGITDLISNIVNADEKNLKDRQNVTKGFSDAVLNKYELEFSTNKIIELIIKNKSTLKGVYLTRSTSGGINKIWKEWNKIESVCNQTGIFTKALITPANYRGGADIKTKIWKECILK